MYMYLPIGENHVKDTIKHEMCTSRDEDFDIGLTSKDSRALHGETVFTTN